MQVACPACHGVVAVPANAPAGIGFRCPKCAAAFTVSPVKPPSVPTGAPVEAVKPKPLTAAPLEAVKPEPPTAAPPSPPLSQGSPRGPARRRKVESVPRRPKPVAPSSIGKSFIVGTVIVALLFLMAGGALLAIWWVTSIKDFAVADSQNAGEIPLRRQESAQQKEVQDTNPKQDLAQEKKAGAAEAPPGDPPQPDPEKRTEAKPADQPSKKVQDPPPALDPPKQPEEPKNLQVEKEPMPASEKKGPEKKNEAVAAPPPVKKIDPVLQQQINGAIARGVNFLVSSQQPIGDWRTHPSHALGVTSLGGLTLLECGLPPDHPSIVRAAALVRASFPNNSKTYEMSVAMLFLDKVGHKKDKELIQLLAARLLAGQDDLGGWDYECPKLTYEQAVERINSLKKGDASGARTKAPPDRQHGGDNSNTQFAMLALWVAGRHDIPVQSALSLAGQQFRATQLAGGQWSYSSKVPSPNPSMTSVGLLGLAMGKGAAATTPKTHPVEKAAGSQVEARSEKQVDMDDQMRKGMGALAVYMAQERKQAQLRPSLYFTWSVQRVGLLYNVQTIGDLDWYQWGVEVLLPIQQPDGSWRTRGFTGTDETIDTSLALLFLKRANLVQDLTDSLLDLQGIAVPKGP
jgi:hypothetical protein